jgi:hypothetical protein
MIKGFSKRQIQNAAWDMTFVQNWRRAALKGIESKRPAILMTGDKAVKDIARRITAQSQEEYIDQLCEPWGRTSKSGMRVFEHYRAAWDATEQDGDRGKKVPNYKAQLQMIEDLEDSLLRV